MTYRYDSLNRAVRQGLVLEQAQLEELKEIAEQERRSISYIVREAITGYLRRRRRSEERRAQPRRQRGQG